MKKWYNIKYIQIIIFLKEIQENFYKYVIYFASGSSSFPKKMVSTSSLLHILQSLGQGSPQKPIHLCLQGSIFGQGSLHGLRLHISKHFL